VHGCEDCDRRSAVAEVAEAVEAEADAVAAILDASTSVTSLRRDGSGLSEAVYFKVAMADGRELKIRVAAHTARPTYQALYGAADFEVGGNRHPDSDGDANAFKEWLS